MLQFYGADSAPVLRTAGRHLSEWSSAGTRTRHWTRPGSGLQLELPNGNG